MLCLCRGSHQFVLGWGPELGVRVSHVGCCRHSGEQGCAVLWGHSLTSPQSKGLSVETPAVWMGPDKSTASCPSLAESGSGERAMRGISVPVCCRMTGYALLFSCFAVKRLSLKGLLFFFYFLHLHSRLNAFLLFSNY